MEYCSTIPCLISLSYAIFYFSLLKLKTFWVVSGLSVQNLILSCHHLDHYFEYIGLLSFLNVQNKRANFGQFTVSFKRAPVKHQSTRNFTNFSSGMENKKISRTYLRVLCTWWKHFEYKDDRTLSVCMYKLVQHFRESHGFLQSCCLRWSGLLMFPLFPWQLWTTQ